MIGEFYFTLFEQSGCEGGIAIICKTSGIAEPNSNSNLLCCVHFRTNAFNNNITQFLLHQQNIYRLNSRAQHSKLVYISVFKTVDKVTGNNSTTIRKTLWQFIYYKEPETMERRGRIPSEQIWFFKKNRCKQ